MLTQRYMQSVKNLDAILDKIIDGTAPERFTVPHLKSLGFKSSNDQSIIPLMKDLGFLTPDGKPTQRYHNYRDASKSKSVMGEALYDAYSELFHIAESPNDTHRKELEGKFKSVHNVKDAVAEKQVRTFLSLLKRAELGRGKTKNTVQHIDTGHPPIINTGKEASHPNASTLSGICQFSGLRYNIEIHLPATKDVEVYNAIFKSLKEHLIDS